MKLREALIQQAPSIELQRAAADEIARLDAEAENLRAALNTAGGALFRLAPACIEDDEDRKDAEHARAVGLAAVEATLKRPSRQ